MRLLLFEFKKMLRTRLFLFLLAGTLLLIGTLFIRNVMQQDVVRAEKIEWFSGYMQEVTTQNRTDRQMLQETPDEELEQKLDIGVALQNQLNGLILSIENGAWEDELQQEIDVYRTAIDYKEVRGNYSFSNGDMEETIRLNKQLLLLGLPKEDISRSVQPPLFMKQIVLLVLNPFGLIVLLVLLGTAITREFEDRNMQMAYTFPIPKWKHVFVKFTGLLIVGLIWLSVLFSASYLLPTLTVESKELVFDYPLSLANGSFLDAGTYINEACIYSVGVLLFAIGVLTLVGFMARQTIISSVIILAVFAGGWMSIRNGMDLLWNPFTYVNVNEAIINYADYFPTGLIVLFGVAAVLLAIAMWGSRNWGVS